MVASIEKDLHFNNYCINVRKILTPTRISQSNWSCDVSVGAVLNAALLCVKSS